MATWYGNIKSNLNHFVNTTTSDEMNFGVVIHTLRKILLFVVSVHFSFSITILAN